ncbi:Glycine cleavage system transcriptional activator [Pseudovibrio axinellae]|uniref:Glycine cleavage system transcriptional activator n=1 Tax=Pseudovibrio axinellae TaxID=989403 RepID=A0A165U0U5_9HYPH|nr:LysR substrate-binding domain-containing protein [Pseudovibrio axinellae]KZL09111.1 Glycine cleavage system transcriptional activator [Pseudovibrio axinellae]SER75669.1 transcriptional regulator, LysR family [Pseudovibrio axinellae]
MNNSKVNARLHPLLKGLNFFASAAKFESFKRAADELCVTESTVSKQIRQAEQFYGKQLFRRGHRCVQLTEDGKRLYDVVDQFLYDLSKIMEDLENSGATIRLKSVPTLGTRWLLTRIADFNSRTSSIQVEVSVSGQPVSFSSEDYDCGLIYGDCEDRFATSIPLFQERATPCCTPDIAAQLFTPEDLYGQTLLLNTADAWDWKKWFREMTLVWMNPQNKYVFECDDQAINAAIHGLGVGLVDPLFVRNELECGALVLPFGKKSTIELRVCNLIFPRHRAQREGFRRFKDWMIKETIDIRC